MLLGIIKSSERSPHNIPLEAQRWSRVIAVPVLNLCTTWEWVVRTMPWPLYPWEKPGVNVTGSWVDPASVLRNVEKGKYTLTGFECLTV